MVRYLLKSACAKHVWISAIALLLVASGFCSDRPKKSKSVPVPPPDLLLEGGRKLSFERSFSSKKDISGKTSFWKKVVDVVAGEADNVALTRPYGVAVDSRGRVIVTDPGAHGVHIFDLEEHKYKFIDRSDARKDAMFEPQCVVVDGKDNIYVSDSRAGKIFIFNSNGKYQGVFGSLKGGEGFFKRPTGIAFDNEKEQVFVTDTLRDKIYVLDTKGSVLRTIGHHGTGEGEFNYPTELLIRGNMLAVVDAMNFRVQIFDRDGTFQAAIGNLGDSVGTFFRPKGIAIDSENHLYLVEGFRGNVQVFDRQGQLLYEFGKRGAELGNFQLPTGVFIDKADHVYVVDSYNRRVQVFQYRGLATRAEGARQ